MGDKCLVLVIAETRFGVEVSQKFPRLYFDLRTAGTEADASVIMKARDAETPILLAGDLDADGGYYADLIRRLQVVEDVPVLAIHRAYGESSAVGEGRDGLHGMVSYEDPPSRYAEAAFMARRLHGSLRDSLSAVSRCRAVFDCYPLAVNEVSLDGVVLDWNESAEALFGWSKEEVIGKYAPHIPEPMRVEYDSMRARVAAGESFINREVLRRGKDGRLLRLILSTAPVRAADGSIRSLVAVFGELERGRAERIIYPVRRAEGDRRGTPIEDTDGLVEAVFGAEKQLVLFLDRDGVVRRAGAFVQKTLGKDPAAVLSGARWTETLIHPDDASRADDFLHGVLGLGRRESLISFISGYGTRVALELYGRRVAGRDGKDGALVIGSVAAAPVSFVPQSYPSASVTGRILEGMDEAVLAFDASCSVVSECNAAAIAVFGLPARELVGRPFDELCPKGYGVSSWAAEELRSRGIGRRDQDLLRANGDRFPARVQLLPVLDENGFVSRGIALIKDLSYERRSSAERDYLTSKLKELAASVAELAARLGGASDRRELSSWGITPSQASVARCINEGMSNKEIAYALDCSETSVKQRVYGLYKKTSTRSRVEFLRFLQDNAIEL